MDKVHIKVDGNRAWCPEMNVDTTSDSPEEAVRVLHEHLRKVLAAEVLVVLPYLGQEFDMQWQDVKIKPPKEPDEFEQAQKDYEFPREKVLKW